MERVVLPPIGRHTIGRFWLSTDSPLVSPLRVLDGIMIYVWDMHMAQCKRHPIREFRVPAFTAVDFRKATYAIAHTPHGVHKQRIYSTHGGQPLETRLCCEERAIPDAARMHYTRMHSSSPQVEAQARLGRDPPRCPISSLISHVWYLISHVSFLLSHLFCLISHLPPLIVQFRHLTSHVSSLISNV